MSLRLLQIVIHDRHRDELNELLDDANPPGRWESALLDDHQMTSVIMRSQLVEPLSDRVREAFGTTDGFRLVNLPVEAAYPKVPEPEEQPESGVPSEDCEGQSNTKETKSWSPRFGRISRDELEEDIRGSSKCDPIFLIMVSLATIVACVGLVKDSPAIIIGAMVIAPLLGPNTALALGTTLGDVKLIRVALRTNLIGITLAIVLAWLIGYIALPDELGHEIVSRTSVDLFDVALALASGAAGAIAFTSGAPATIVGVMVAVALLPPTATAGMLVGAGEWKPAGGAFTMALTNIACINLSATAVFLIQGVRPSTWWEKDRARRASTRAMILWACVLASLCALILYAW